MDMIKSLEFKRVNNEFQSYLRNDIRQIRQSNNLFVSADKSRNIYKVNKASYEQMMHENVTKTYKKCSTNECNCINFKAKQIASRLKIDDLVQKLDKNEAYVTIKDHKEEFSDEMSCRPINPSKTDIGKNMQTNLRQSQQQDIRKKQSKPVGKHVFSYRMVP